MVQLDVQKTIFRTHISHYEFLVMSFRLSNVLAIFQHIMNELILVFFYNILIYSSTWFDHLIHLQIVLQALLDNGFVAKRKKSSFGKLQVLYLGHMIFEQGVSMDSLKIFNIIKW